MIFRPELAKLIIQRKKSMTRRPIRGETACRYQIGHVYQVQPGRGKRGMFPITIKTVHDEALGDISLKDAKREGFVTTQEFVDYWTSLYGRFDRDLRVWVISFALGDSSDAPRLLAARPGAPHGDYVTQSFLAARGEPEAVSGGEQAAFTALGRMVDRERGKHPDQVLRDGLVRELERWQASSGGQTDRDRAGAIRGIRRQLAVLDQKLKAA